MKFDVLIVDPPWSYNNKKTGGSHSSGSEQKYDTMSLIELAQLESYIHPLMNVDSCCFIWTTNSMIFDAFTLMGIYGYSYKTLLTWNKKRYGMGFWFRGQTEHCLFGIRGKVPALRSTFPNLLEEKSFKHSRKPDSFYYMIQTLFAGKNILELFATRERFANWTCIGNEISGMDIVTDLTKLLEGESAVSKLQKYMKEKGDI